MATRKPARKAVASPAKRAAKKAAPPVTRRRGRGGSSATAAGDDVTAGDLIGSVGAGGETHQTAAAGATRLTTQQGIPVADDQNTLKAGERGPSLLDDFHFREKIFHFDHERIPERVVHARGFGAHGFFEPYESLADVTRADLFQRAGEQVPVFVRFSTVAGNKGSFDLARDVRGFAVKFYTQEGNWDLVGNNIPVFFIQDAIKFPDLVHAVKQAPDRGFPQAQSAHDNFWDFISLMPEATHMVMWTMSDRAIPRSFRFMEGFGVHTFRFVDAAGASTFVKFHWKPKLGLQSVVWNEAVKINGADPDFHRRDLWDAINGGDFPEWELGVQLFDDAFADSFDFDVLDATKIIPEELVPVRRVGRLVLDRTVDNFFAETEQVAFCTQNVVPGIDFTQRPAAAGPQLLLPRHAAEAARRPELHAHPGQRPEVPGRPLPAGRPHGDDEPGRAGQLRAELVDRRRRRTTRGPGRRLHQLPAAGRGRQAAGPLGALRRPLQPGPPVLRLPDRRSSRPTSSTRSCSSCPSASSPASAPAWWPTCATSTRTSPARSPTGCGSRPTRSPTVPARPPITDLPPSPALSIVANGPATFAGRKIGVLVTDGTDAARRSPRCARRRPPKAPWSSSSPRRSAVPCSATAHCYPAHQTIDGGPSVLYDAVAILASAEGAALLAADAAAKDFVTDAHAHCKFIAYHPDCPSLCSTPPVVSGRHRRRLPRGRQAGDGHRVHRVVPGPALLGPHPERRPDLTATLRPHDERPLRVARAAVSASYMAVTASVSGGSSSARSRSACSAQRAS